MAKVCICNKVFDEKDLKEQKENSHFYSKIR
jgi:hypothetical protein